MRLLIATVFIAFSLSTTANANNFMPDYSAERKKFNKAVQLLQKNKLTSYAKHKDQLENYPLSGYLQYYALVKKISAASPTAITNFMERRDGSPLTYQLNRKWLNHLAKNKNWAAYKQHYAQYPIAKTHYLCQQQVALLHGSKKERKEALYNAKKLWLVSNSQPKSCDPLFKEWTKTGRPTLNEASQRFWLSLEEGNTKLARYLGKYITKGATKKQSELFWKIYNNPSLLEGKLLLSADKNHQATIAKLSYKRWFRSHPVTASKHWAKNRQKLVPDTMQQHKITAYMGQRLNRNYHSQAAQLSHLLDPNYEISDLTEARIRNSLAKQNWKLVLSAVENLPDSSKKEMSWQYWGLMAQMHLNPEKDFEEMLNPLAKSRSYYGFLAAELNNSPFLLNAQQETVDKETIKALAQRPGIQRSYELFRLGRLTEANREWYRVQQQLDKAEKSAAGYLANAWGWHLQAIIVAAKTKSWDNITLRFPHPHAGLFKSHAIKNKMDLSFPVAIARQESAFLHTARSRVGARGLMQLMPNTAKETAKKHKVPYRRTSELSNPELNITLGSAYLGDMLKKFGGNPAYAAAAYNAGPHRVTRWLKARGDLPLDIWIETIPFKETRKYVKNVLAFRVIYDRLEGRQASLLTEKHVKLLAVNQSNRAAL